MTKFFSLQKYFLRMFNSSLDFTCYKWVIIQQVNYFTALLAAAHKGWNLVRYWGMLGTTTLPATAGNDLHLKCIFCLAYVFFSWCNLVPFCISLLLELPMCHYSSPVWKTVSKFQVAHIISSYKRDNLYFVCKFSDIANKHTT